MRVFIAIHMTQTALALTTTAMTFTRQIVHYFNRARGLALAIVASGPAFFGAFVAPLLNNYVEAHGWRAGYLAAALVCGVLGGLALLFLPAAKAPAKAPPLARLSSTKADYAGIFRNTGFWILMWAILLCHIPTVVALSQLTLLMSDNGVTTAHASIMLTAFAAGTLLGRFGCGLALDRWPMHIVAALSLGLPVVGMLLMASPFDAPPLLLIAVLFIALASGAEADLLGYIIANKFGTRVYSSVLGLISVALTIAGALGALLLSVSLGLTQSSNLFLLISAVSATIGALLLLRLKNIKPYEEANAVP